MDPFTLALATFGVQKLRGKSTKRALRDAAIVGGGSYAVGAISGGAGGIGQGAPFSGAKNFLGMGQAKSSLPQLPFEATQGAQFRDAGYQKALSVGAENTARETGITKLLNKAKENPFQTAILASSVIPLLGDEEEIKPPFTEEDYKQAYKEQAAKLEGAFTPTEDAMPTRAETYGSNMFYANQGGLATAVPKFNKGGVNYLPSKTDHNENDLSNYVRAEGYVEDGSGNGNKDEDTMLAQLADGEFVSRADAVLGAGILSGGDPKSYSSMRKAGAGFFYDQQKKLKRIYDLVDASRKDN